VFYRIFGKNGSGKTSYIYDRLSECVRNEKKAFLVVPEQSAVATETEIIKKLGGKSNLYVEVINFKRLCNRVFRELGGLTSVHIDEGAKRLLMLLCLDEVSDHLKEYGKSAESAEFAEKAVSFVNELSQCRVSTSKLEKAAENLSANGDSSVSSKLFDLALISEAYLAKLSSIPGVCCDIYEKLCAKLKEGNFFGGCDVFFDSFYGFTQSEYEIISVIAEQADNVYVTFPCQPDTKDEMFERSTKSAKMCTRLAERSGCNIQDIVLDKNFRHRKDSDLCHFSQIFSSEALTYKADGRESDSSISITLCKNIYDEAKFAAGRVTKLVREGARFSDIAVCAKNTEDYVGVIDTFFAKANIPLGMDIPETLSESSLFELVTSALEAASTFSGKAVIRFIKTGICGLSEEEADRLETYIKTWDISPSLMKCDEDWTMNPDGYAYSQPDEYTLETVNSARRKVLVCLEALSHNIKNSKTVTDFCTAVYNLIEDITRISGKDVFDDAAGGVTTALLYECLDSFVSFAGNERISLARFVSLFRSCGEDYNTGHIPARMNEVRFSGVDLVRCENVKHVILLGVNNGVFPSSCTSGSLVTDAEKKLLKNQGIELSEDASEKVFDELFLAYNVITSASESCSITYLEEDLSASALYPSVIVNSVKEICGCEITRCLAEDVAQNFAGDEILFEEYSAMDEGKTKNTLEKYFSRKEDYVPRLEGLSGILSQDDCLDRATTDMLYDDKIVTSYTRLEKMVECPFKHFCTYVLKLKAEPSAVLGGREAGTIMHKILEELVPVLCRAKEDGTYPDEEEAKALVSELLQRYLSAISHTDPSRLPKRFVYLYNRLSRILDEMAVNIVRELKVTKFVPSDFELSIRRDAEIKPVPIDLGDGCTLYITGQIDRVDVYEKDGVSYIKIVDYKTGKKEFNLKEVKCGFNLQMLLYLAAIREGGREKYGKNIVPAGVLYSNVILNALNLTLGDDDIASEASETSAPVASGIFINDEEILLAMDSSEEKLYIPVKKKDALTTLEEMGELLDSSIELAKALAKEMRDGLKSVTPFDGRAEGIRKDPCEYCDMYPVCLGDIKTGDNSPE